jgi:C4-dicarboxylate-specific signal transduction histidine kinase
VSPPAPGPEKQEAPPPPPAGGAPGSLEAGLEALARRVAADAAYLMLREEDRLVPAARLHGRAGDGTPWAQDPRLTALAARALEAGRGVQEAVPAESRPRSGGERGVTYAALRLEGLGGPFGVAVLGYRVRPADLEARLDALGRDSRAAVLALEHACLRAQLDAERAAFAASRRVLEQRVRKAEERRRVLIHILSDLNRFNRRLVDQGKAMIHILTDYEKDRREAGLQAERLDGSRRALLNILKDSHESNLRLADSRKAMIHIMDDLRETTREIRQREQELRDKQEQLVQAGKLATLGELTTGVAHELNNPLNNIGLYVGNVIDLIELGRMDKKRILAELNRTMLQIRKATEIISHLRTFGRAAPVSREPVMVNQVIQRALALLHEQFRLREIQVATDLSEVEPVVTGNPIQIEQVALNLLANARDAVARATLKRITIVSRVREAWVELVIEDSGPGIPRGLEQRIFDPFFTTKEVGAGTGLGLSITYGIIREHGGSIEVTNAPGRGARFTILLPAGREP